MHGKIINADRIEELSFVDSVDGDVLHTQIPFDIKLSYSKKLFQDADPCLYYSKKERSWFGRAGSPLSEIYYLLPSGHDIFANQYYIVTSIQNCWKCKKQTRVYAILILLGINIHSEMDAYTNIPYPFYLYNINNLNTETLQVISKEAPTLQYVYSKTVGRKYYGCLCEHCSSLQGNFYLYQEPGGAFGHWPYIDCPIQKISLHSHLSADSGYIGIDCNTQLLRIFKTACGKK